jgi:hypothetical protein
VAQIDAFLAGPRLDRDLSDLLYTTKPFFDASARKVKCYSSRQSLPPPQIFDPETQEDLSMYPGKGS